MASVVVQGREDRVRSAVHISGVGAERRLRAGYGHRLDLVAAERQQLTRTVTIELRRAQPGAISDFEWHRLRTVARDIQDGILRTRLDVSRVPEWFYRRYRNRDELDFADTAEGHRSRLAA